MNKAGRVWEYSKENPQGFTLNLETMEQPQEGICVAYIETQGSHGREQLTRVINHAKANSGFVGGWLEEETGLYYFDSVRVFPESQEQEARAFALENEQHAYFILSKGEEVKL